MSVYPLTKSILLLGDSITQNALCAGGYSQMLSETYARKLDVINRGYGGYNSSWLLEVTKQMVAAKGTKGLSEVALVVVFIGANDAVVPKLNPRQHVPLDLYSKNVAEILHLFPPSTPKILITPPPIQESQLMAAFNLVVPDRLNSLTGTYAQAVRDLGKEEGVPVVDLYEGFGKVGEEKWEGLFTDGLHLTVAGYKMVYTALMSVIKTKYPELDPERLPQVFPAWDTVDLEDPAKSLQYKGQ